jgi:hypothetical protein
VELVIETDGTWMATVWNPLAPNGEESPYITCRDTLLALSPVLRFSGEGAVDTTAQFVGSWQDQSESRLPQFGYFEASYFHTFLTRDSLDAGPLIVGRYHLTISGSCQRTMGKRFWLRQTP